MYAFEKLVSEKGHMEYLDTSILSPEVANLENSLRKKIIGQDRAIHHIIKAYVPTTVGINRPNRPLGVFLFCGPTGVGKSELVKVFARLQLSAAADSASKVYLTKIDCNEYGESHEVMKLLGAPPSYVGYNDEPRFSQNKIDQYQTKTKKINVILFDEIEKADPRLFDAILSILGDGKLTLGNGKETDFSQSYIFLTSNIGSKETQKIIERSNLGFGSSRQIADDMDDKIYRTTKEAIKRKFRPEFVNRLDSLVVFRSLDPESMNKILDIEIHLLHKRIWEAPFKNWKPGGEEPPPQARSINFSLTKPARDFILKEGFSDLYGARELNRTIDRYITFPIANLFSSGQISHGDKLIVEYFEGDKHLKFRKAGKFMLPEGLIQ